jgi:hypothetical protein
MMDATGSRIVNPPISRYQAFILRPGRVEMWDREFALEPWVIECQPGQEVAFLLDVLARCAEATEESDRAMMERAWNGE